MKTLQTLFLHELSDIYDAEKQIVHALPKLAEATTCEKLKKALHTNLKESEVHVRRLDHVFESVAAKPHGRTCEVASGLVKEAHELITHFKGSPVLNAALVNMVQKIEHYEIASYGGLHEWANILGNKKGAGILAEILAEEKASNEFLITLARSTCNPEALAHSEKTASSTVAAEVKQSPAVHSTKPATVPPISPAPHAAAAATR